MKPLLCLLFLFIATSAHAQSWNWNAVITQGLFHTDANNIYGKSKDDVSFDYTEASLNGSYSYSDMLRVAGQSIYRHAGSGFDGVHLDYLFMDSQALNRENISGGFRLGRSKVPLGLYNDSRDVAFTRSGINLSQSVYQDVLLRELYISADGVGLYLNLFSDIGQFDFELLHGNARRDSLDTLQELFLSSYFDIREATAYRVQYANPAGTFIMAFSGTYVDTLSFELQSLLFGGLPLTPPAFLDIDAIFVVHPKVLSLQYFLDTWIFTVEYGEFRVHGKIPQLETYRGLLRLLPSVVTEVVTDFETVRTAKQYYFHIQKHISQQWMTYMLYDIYDTFPGGITGATPDLEGLVKDLGVGIRWTPRANTLINLEYHYIEGTSWLSPSDNNDLDDFSHYWNLVAMSFSYRF